MKKIITFNALLVFAMFNTAYAGQEKSTLKKLQGVAETNRTALFALGGSAMVVVSGYLAYRTYNIYNNQSLTEAEIQQVARLTKLGAAATTTTVFGLLGASLLDYARVVWNEPKK